MNSALFAETVRLAQQARGTYARHMDDDEKIK